MNKRWIFVDCDDTLVMWPPFAGPDRDLIHIPDPYNKKKPPIGLFPHKRQIDFIKKSAQFNKDTIVVWSAGGQPWAKAVVKALGLKPYVKYVIAKPDFYVDDLHCTEFMGYRKYFDYKPEEEGEPSA